MLSSEAARSLTMAHLIPFLYADQPLAELGRNVTGSAHSGDSGLTTLLQADALYAAGSDDKAADLLVRLIDGGTSPTRVKLWAAAALRNRGMMPGGPGAVEVQGVVMDVPVAGGRDLLGVYRDASARFISHSGAVAAYDGDQPAISDICRKVIAAAGSIVSGAKGFALDANSPKVTVLTLSGPIVAGSQSPVDDVLRRGAALIAKLAAAAARR
jgi:hypothetical protein